MLKTKCLLILAPVVLFVALNAESKLLERNNETVNVITDATLSITLKSNHRLSAELKLWAESKHYKIAWKSEKDFIITNTIVISGNDMTVILDKLGKLFMSEQYGLKIKLYSGNNVIVVDTL